MTDVTITASNVSPIVEDTFVFILNITPYSTSQEHIHGVFDSLEAAQNAAQEHQESRLRNKKPGLRVRWDAGYRDEEWTAEAVDIDSNFRIVKWKVDSE